MRRTGTTTFEDGGAPPMPGSRLGGQGRPHIREHQAEATTAQRTSPIQSVRIPTHSPRHTFAVPPAGEGRTLRARRIE